MLLSVPVQRPCFAPSSVSAESSAFPPCSTSNIPTPAFSSDIAPPSAPLKTSFCQIVKMSLHFSASCQMLLPLLVPQRTSLPIQVSWRTSLPPLTLRRASLPPFSFMLNVAPRSGSALSLRCLATPTPGQDIVSSLCSREETALHLYPREYVKGPLSGPARDDT